jgi:hypothetical protein
MYPYCKKMPLSSLSGEGEGNTPVPMRYPRSSANLGSMWDICGRTWSATSAGKNNDGP